VPKSFCVGSLGERTRLACGCGRRARNIGGQISWLTGFWRDAEKGNRDGCAPPSRSDVMTIARHFNAGCNPQTFQVPQGRPNQPSRWDSCRRRRIPGVKTPGYCRVVPSGRTPCQNHFALDVWGNGHLAVAERRKKVAHGETVGERTRLNQAPDGAGEICVGWFSVAPAGALVAG
jgi:hypothetical protein